MRRIALFALAAFAIAFAHNAWSIDQPWVKFGQGWMLIVMTVYVWSLIRDRTGRKASSETCTGFLLRALEKKRDGFLAVRRVVLLIIPAILASWWGGGPALKARANRFGSVFAQLSLLNQHLADHRHMRPAATRLVRVWRRCEEGLRRI